MEPQTFGQRVKRAARKTLRLAIMVIILGGIILFSFYYWAVYDEGVRAGMVLRVSKKGMLFKTYEGQLNLNTFGALKGTSTMAESFDFSVTDEQVVKELEAVALSGERVNLHYIKRYVAFPWRGDTKYFVTKVERLEGAQPNTNEERKFP
ncbi:MAG: 6-phosphogluconate dehydrogenase [Bacteroidia bacterium]|nr:6-phosphogluconate dehydrogenase [Bacteroidia bacterium]